MNNQKDDKRQNTTIYYCSFYLAMTVLFYVFLPFVISFPFLAITGAHMPHYLLLFTSMLIDANYVSPGGLLVGALIAAELIFLIALVVVSVMAFWKKKYSPFWILSVFSNAFTIITVIFAYCQSGDSVVLSGDVLCSIIGNIVFRFMLYRRIYRATGD